MKSYIISIVAVLTMLPVIALAEGNGNDDWAEKAARQYEEKAAFAQKNGNPRAAEIFRRMAQIKRDAGAAAKDGKPFDWAEYHKLNEKLQQAHQENRGKDERPRPDNRDKGKDHAEGEGAGSGFIRAAEEYERAGKKAAQQGDEKKAHVCFALAKIKRQAAEAAKQGKDFNWDEYDKLKKSLHGGDEQQHQKPRPEQEAPRKLNIE